MKPSDLIILIPRLLAVPGLLETDSDFLRRIHKQGGTPGNKKDRKRFRRLLSEHLPSIPLYPREYEEPTPKAVPERTLLVRVPRPQKELAPPRVHVLRRLSSHRESDDAYPVVARLSDKVRVIECADRIQWILQRRRGERWNGVSFCRTRSALIRDASNVLGYVPNALKGLPKHYDDGLSKLREAA